MGLIGRDPKDHSHGQRYDSVDGVAQSLIQPGLLEHFQGWDNPTSLVNLFLYFTMLLVKNFPQYLT